MADFHNMRAQVRDTGYQPVAGGRESNLTFWFVAAGAAGSKGCDGSTSPSTVGPHPRNRS